MEVQAATETAERLAAEVRAEMARQRRTAKEMAEVVGITAHTAGRRLSGAVPFNVVELGEVARWLGIRVDVLMERAEERARAVAS
ncbi:helix-turn-helix domain-containing protein [Microbacterium sp. IEGM 1404]|uniref:helix-turn-helix domain-containing protein n=1 Tax=Microbacterium sp. IEGM 1404 TaxID=3047084 RepID=UPI0024B7D004|nr:helix-turn-helix domain-containing protein [Microbacterium sp. IEGM 1404]MDI9889928.1 helix-turn-helix domain-containing protein [Microbacterium sp. IEGM 1404]